MKRTAMDELEKHKSELVEAASTLLAVQHCYGENVRKQALAAFGKLVDAHMITTGVLGTALLRVNGKFAEITPTSTRRNALFASFVIGLTICECAICEGRYLQAIALLRQEAETLAALCEVTAGKRKHGKTPNMSGLASDIARLYGDLSAGAHVAVHAVVHAATEWTGSIEGASGPAAMSRHFPMFDEHLARRLYGLHIYLMIRLIEQLNADFSQMHPEAFTSREIEAIDMVIDLMVQEKILERDGPLTGAIA